MKNLFVLILLIFLSCLQSNSQSGWFQQNSSTSQDFYVVYFINENNGFSGGPWILMSSSNSGNNWIQYGNTNTLGIYFLNDLTGFLQGSTLYKTINGGTNWYFISLCQNYESYNSIYFFNEDTGYRSGGFHFSIAQSAYIQKTSNGGVNWSTVFYIQDGSDFTNLQFKDSCFGYSITKSAFARTTNAGQTWINSYPTGPGLKYGLMFINAETGFLCGSGSCILRTSNKGINWAQYNIESNVQYNTIFFVNHLTGYCAGNSGKIIKTTNSGINWHYQSSVTTENLIDIYFINENIGFIVGENGTILKTTDGGGPIGIQSISSEVSMTFSLSQNYPNPFNPVTKIKFQIPTVGQRHAFDLRLFIYDILGREVAVLVNEQVKPGSYEVEFDGSNYPSGVYFYRLTAGEYTETKKMILIK